jgi:hypothetical protein
MLRQKSTRQKRFKVKPQRKEFLIDPDLLIGTGGPQQYKQAT